MTRVRFPSPAPSGFGVQVKSFRPCGSVVEHSLGKGEIAGPIPAMGTKDLSHVGLSHVDSSIVFLMFFSESRNGKREI